MTRAPQHPEQDLQSDTIPSALVAAFRTLGRTGKRVVVAVPIVLLAYAMIGASHTWVLYLLAIVAAGVIALLHRQGTGRSTTPAAPLIAERPARQRPAPAVVHDEDAIGYDGSLEYEQVLQELQALVGREVEVVISTPDLLPLSLHRGVLRAGLIVGDAQALFIDVSSGSGSGFYIHADRFLHARPDTQGDDLVLEVVTADEVIWFSELNPAPA